MTALSAVDLQQATVPDGGSRGKECQDTPSTGEEDGEISDLGASKRERGILFVQLSVGIINLGEVRSMCPPQELTLQ